MKIHHRREPNPELYFKLMAILDYCYAPTRAIKRGMNDSALMRVLGTSRRNIRTMRNECPDWPWWPTVMREAIADILPHLPKWQRRLVNKKLRELPEDYVQHIEYATEARDWLIAQLKDGPAIVSELLSTANRGDISVIRIKRAAQALGVLKTREGRRKDHISVWSLPTSEDD
jgi:hypothetical protein